jgi:hypothetical protein
MKRFWQLQALLICFLTATVGFSMQSTEKWIGTWKMNPAKSKYSPGPPDREWTLQFEKTDAGIKLTSFGINAQGEKRAYTFVSRFDGTEVLWMNNPSMDACAPLKMNDNLYVNIAKKGGKLLQIVRVEVSQDGKTLTVVQTGNVDNLVVYDRK